MMWEGSEVLEPRELATHNVRSALESAVRLAASVIFALDDCAAQVETLSRLLRVALEEMDTWQVDGD